MRAHGKEPATAGAAANSRAPMKRSNLPESLQRGGADGAKEVPSSLTTSALNKFTFNTKIQVTCLEGELTLFPELFACPRTPGKVRHARFAGGVWSLCVIVFVHADTGERYVVKIPNEHDKQDLRALNCEFEFTKTIALNDTVMKECEKCICFCREGSLRWTTNTGEVFELDRPVGVSRFGGSDINSLRILASHPNIIEAFQKFCMKYYHLMHLGRFEHGDLNHGNVVYSSDSDGNLQFRVIDCGFARCMSKASEPGHKRSYDAVEEVPAFVERAEHEPPYNYSDQIRLAMIFTELMLIVNSLGAKIAGGSDAAGGSDTAGASDAAGAAERPPVRFLLFGMNGKQFKEHFFLTTARATRCMRTAWERTNKCAQCGNCGVETVRCLCCFKQICQEECMQKQTNVSQYLFCKQCSTAASCNNPKCPKHPCTPLPADQEVAVVEESTNKVHCKICFKVTCGTEPTCLFKGKCVNCIDLRR